MILPLLKGNSVQAVSAHAGHHDGRYVCSENRGDGRRIDPVRFDCFAFKGKEHSAMPETGVATGPARNEEKGYPKGRVPEAADVHFMPLEGPARLDLTARPVRDSSIGRRFLTEAGLNRAFTKTLTARIARKRRLLFET
jgi:hypothetical protein